MHDFPLDSFWTGPRPSAAPGLDARGFLRSLPLPDTARCTRQALLDYFDNGWALTELLFSSLLGEGSIDERFGHTPSHGLRHPMVFYYAHPAVLFINKLRLAGLLERGINAHFERLFETGVDEMRWDDMGKNARPWPPMLELRDYRREAYRRIRDILETHPGLDDGHAPILRGHPLWAILLGCEHERIHIETSSVLLRELPLRCVRRPREWAPLHASAVLHERDRSRFVPPQEGVNYPGNSRLMIAPGHVRIGKATDHPSYGWDNEYGHREHHVRAFEVTAQLICNGEFYEFVRAGGYAQRRYWDDEGWTWRSRTNAKWPTFWVPTGPAGLHEYALRTCFEVIEMPWSWPAVVNYHEARAYAAFVGEREGSRRKYRLLTEAEHHRLRDPEPARDNLALAHGSEWPVDAGPPAASGARDVFGSVWQWCEDDFNPLPGFAVDPLYEDFSTPCFDGQHRMIMGGSWISTGDEASRHARFHFRPHFFQHAGFRLVRSDSDDAVRIATRGEQDSYESAAMLEQYLVLHYGAVQEQVPEGLGLEALARFPQRCAALLVELARARNVTLARALELGCAVGGACFELARSCDAVTGVDLSASFIDMAERIKATGELELFVRDEGELGQARAVQLDPTIDRARVEFVRVDVCNLPERFADFDLVLAANLLCRVADPRALLERLAGLVRAGGLLALVSPYSWLERYTARDEWLGGFADASGPRRSREGVLAALGARFELIHEQDLPLLIREHGRKSQLIVSHAMVLQRCANETA